MKVESGKWKAVVLICVSMVFHFPLFSFHSAKAQVAGTNALAVLDMPATARTAGLGFDYLALYGDDLTVGIDNPSLLHHTMGGTAVLSVVPMFSGGTRGVLTYAHNFKRLGTISFGFHFMNYGAFQEYDGEETRLGRFSAGEYALNVGWGMWLDSNFSVGVNFKPVVAQYERYTSVAVSFDVAGSYVSSDRTFAATVMARNVGAQIVTFDETVERLPFDLSAELSYKLKNAPFRLFFAAEELQRWNLRYEDPLHPTSETDPFTGEVTRESWFAGTFDNLMRHTQFGVELNLGRALYARVGYSWRQTAEMRGVDAFNLSGFSFGFGVRTRRFEFGYARRNYHLVQAPNYFTVSYIF